MKTRRFVAYYRVSTDQQGRSGLGLDAQREAVQAFSTIIAEFTEIESGKRDDRPQLALALEHCRIHDAALLIAKIDRLSRDAAFLFTLRKAGVEIVAADMPQAGTLEFGIRAVFAQHEREEISRRTKAALAAAKARGVKLGCPTPRNGNRVAVALLQARARAFSDTILPFIVEAREAGRFTMREIAAYLAERGVRTFTGKPNWHPSQVHNVINYAENA